MKKNNSINNTPMPQRKPKNKNNSTKNTQITPSPPINIGKHRNRKSSKKNRMLNTPTIKPMDSGDEDTIVEHTKTNLEAEATPYYTPTTPEVNNTYQYSSSEPHGWGDQGGVSRNLWADVEDAGEDNPTPSITTNESSLPASALHNNPMGSNVTRNSSHGTDMMPTPSVSTIEAIEKIIRRNESGGSEDLLPESPDKLNSLGDDLTPDLVAQNPKPDATKYKSNPTTVTNTTNISLPTINLIDKSISSKIYPKDTTIIKHSPNISSVNSSGSSIEWRPLDDVQTTPKATSTPRADVYRPLVRSSSLSRLNSDDCQYNTHQNSSEIVYTGDTPRRYITELNKTRIYVRGVRSRRRRAPSLDGITLFEDSELAGKPPNILLYGPQMTIPDSENQARPSSAEEDLLTGALHISMTGRDALSEDKHANEHLSEDDQDGPLHGSGVIKSRGETAPPNEEHHITKTKYDNLYQSTLKDKEDLILKHNKELDKLQNICNNALMDLRHCRSKLSKQESENQQKTLKIRENLAQKDIETDRLKNLYDKTLKDLKQCKNKLSDYESDNLELNQALKSLSKNNANNNNKVKKQTQSLQTERDRSLIQSLQNELKGLRQDHLQLRQQQLHYESNKTEMTKSHNEELQKQRTYYQKVLDELTYCQNKLRKCAAENYNLLLQLKNKNYTNSIPEVSEADIINTIEKFTDSPFEEENYAQLPPESDSPAHTQGSSGVAVPTQGNGITTDPPHSQSNNSAREEHGESGRSTSIPTMFTKNIMDRINVIRYYTENDRELMISCGSGPMFEPRGGEDVALESLLGLHNNQTDPGLNVMLMNDTSDRAGVMAITLLKDQNKLRDKILKFLNENDNTSARIIDYANQNWLYTFSTPWEEQLTKKEKKELHDPIETQTTNISPCEVEDSRTDTRGVVICHRCQDYGHLEDNCNNKPICRICGLEHWTSSHRGLNVAMCVHCRSRGTSAAHEMHTANCPVYCDITHIDGSHRVSYMERTAGAAPLRSKSCFGCGSVDHLFRDCPWKCSVCVGQPHTTDQCPRARIPVGPPDRVPGLMEIWPGPGNPSWMAPDRSLGEWDGVSGTERPNWNMDDFPTLPGQTVGPPDGTPDATEQWSAWNSHKHNSRNPNTYPPTQYAHTNNSPPAHAHNTPNIYSAVTNLKHPHQLPHQAKDYETYYGKGYKPRHTPHYYPNNTDHRPNTAPKKQKYGINPHIQARQQYQRNINTPKPHLHYPLQHPHYYNLNPPPTGHYNIHNA
jgi:hypothetical protein